jgi:hypothetical protein
MEDVTANTTKRVVCRHGADNWLRFESTRTDAGYTYKATECICKRCLEDFYLAGLRGSGQPALTDKLFGV